MASASPVLAQCSVINGIVVVKTIVAIRDVNLPYILKLKIATSTIVIIAANAENTLSPKALNPAILYPIAIAQKLIGGFKFQ